MNRVWTTCLAVACGTIAGPALADTLCSQPLATTGAMLHSSYWDPDGSDYDEYVWDSFQLASTANVTGVDWYGGYGFLTGGGTINSFKVKIYASIPAGTQPDLGYLYPGPLKSFTVSGNAAQTLVGTYGGQNIYSYHANVPGGFQAAAGTKYWVQIEAWQPGFPSWGIAVGTGGNGSHFHRTAGVADAYYYIGSGDAAFSLTGTPVACNNPTITSSPTPVTGCFPATDATFSTTATGNGTLTYRWRKNGNPVYDGPNGGGSGGGAYISGATTPTLTIQMASYWADVGTYDCVVTNACGSTTSGSATLSITSTGPAVTQSPQPAQACPGDTVTFTAVSADATWFDWYQDGALLTDGPTASGAIISGAGSATLTISGVQTTDQGAFTCVAWNDCFSSPQTPPAALTVGGPACPAACDPIDFNNDGLFPDTADIDDFLSVFSGGPCSTAACADIDFNNDGLFPDTADIDALLNVFSGGPCI
ncbi:MAG: immunoglobulin domain-containing protein [Phycisphaerales bacterium]